MDPSEVTTDDYHIDSTRWSNYSEHDDHESSRVGPILFFVITILFGTFGNGLVVLAFYMHSHLRAHSINVYMVHTSVVNLVISAVVNPIYIAIFAHITDNIKLLYRTIGIIAMMDLANVLSMYSLCAVATNRYLLITRPNTTFRSWCVPRKRIAYVLVGIWLAAIATVLSYFTPIFYSVFYENLQVLETFFKASPALLFLWFLPILIVPIMHLSTLRAIKVHRKRMEGQSSGFGVDVKEQRRTQAFGSNPPDRSTAVLHQDYQIELANPPGPSCLGNEQNEIVPGKMIKSSIKERDGESNIQSSDTCRPKDDAQPRRPSSSAYSFSTLGQKKGQNVQNEAQIRKHGMAESEVRLVKMMVLMYIVLIISVVPYIIYSIPGVDEKYYQANLEEYAFLMPVYPTTMPYIFLWSNKNFRSAVAKIVRNMRKLRNGEVGP